MAQRHDESQTPLLDAWIEEDGEAAILEAAEEIRRRVADGSLPMFEDQAQLMEHLRRGRVDNQRDTGALFSATPHSHA